MGGQKDTDVDVVDVVQRVACVVIWGQGEDEFMSMGKIRFVLWNDWGRILWP